LHTVFNGRAYYNLLDPWRQGKMPDDPGQRENKTRPGTGEVDPSAEPLCHCAGQEGIKTAGPMTS
jgi:hypothetical protein